MNVFISPTFPNADAGDGGIRRVVEAQIRYLPAFGMDVVDTEAESDVVAVHAGSYVATRKPLVSHNHGLYWNEYQWGMDAHNLNRACINLLRRCDAATAPSNWVSYIIKRGMNIDARTVYHGVDVGDWTMGPKEHPYVLWNKTRVDPICDPTPVVELAKRMPDVDFVTTFGDADLKNMRVTGRMPHAHSKVLVERASVYLATSRETFGIGTLEAMAAGAVVVGWDWAGQSEFVRSGTDGLLVPVGDYRALAQAVREALANHDKYAEAARNSVMDWTWEQAAEHYAAIYREVVEKAAARRCRTSVVVTCYNLAHTLERAVNSVLTQDDKDVEVLIVDDASPDETATVAAMLAARDERVKVVTNTENLYLAESLNAGIAASTGRYIVPLDADNELAPGALGTLADALDINQDVDIVYGAMSLIQEWEGGISQTSGWPPATFTFEQQMAHRNQIPSTSMYRYKWWERGLGYRRRCRTAEDADFWCRITSLGAQPIRATDAPTLIYHERRDSMSHAEADWPWQNWYTWSRIPELTPWGAPAARRPEVPTLEPAAVTVVIPVGPGHRKYLSDALDSLVAQTYTNWRCIIVQDSGVTRTDDYRLFTWNEPDLTLPPWVQLYQRVMPGPYVNGTAGPARARNQGLYAAETPYVLFLDADDYLAPNALEVMLAAATERRNPNEWYYSDWIKQEQNVVYQAADFNTEHMRTNLIHSVTAMYPTALARQVKGFDETLDAWEDWDFVLKLIEAGGCGVHLPFPLFYYRYHAGQRREALYADRTRHFEVMLQKWHNIMVEKAPMGCGCSGGKTVYSTPVKVGNQPIPVSKDGATLVEFQGVSAPRTYRGAHKEYRFGSDSGHRRHYVNNEDLHIFQHRPGFQLVVADNAGMATLEAKGPPVREAELAIA